MRFCFVLAEVVQAFTLTHAELAIYPEVCRRVDQQFPGVRAEAEAATSADVSIPLVIFLCALSSR
eukprot:SAG31_NODE_1000_length_10456_cov_3.588394_1_plen_64_part_10